MAGRPYAWISDTENMCVPLMTGAANINWLVTIGLGSPYRAVLSRGSGRVSMP